MQHSGNPDEDRAKDVRTSEPSSGGAFETLEQNLPPVGLEKVAQRYAIVRLLGRGAFGEVYLALDEVLEREVCVKILHPGRRLDPDFGSSEERLIREAQAAAKLRHPNIVMVHDVVQDGDRLAIIMEFVDGESLREKLQREHRLETEEAIHIAVCIADALAFAHKHGIVHRDIKPANIFLDRDGSVKVGDFGLARMGDKPGVTADGVLVGTPAYMAPEQVRGDPVDGRSDLFSLGSLLYEMLTGASPFDDSSMAAVLFKVAHQKPKPLSSSAIRVPAFVHQALMRALEKNPNHRFRTASQFADVLRGVLPAPRRVSRAGRFFRRPGLWAAVLACGAALMGVWALRNGNTPKRRVNLSLLEFQNQTQRDQYAFIADGFTSELMRLLPDGQQIILVPQADVLDGLKRGQTRQDAARRAGATHLLSAALESASPGLILRCELLDAESNTVQSDRIPVDSEDLQAALKRVHRQMLIWLGLPQSRTQRTVDHEAFALYIRGLSSLKRMGEGDRQAFEQGVALLERAADIEPSVEVYAGLARLHLEAVNFGISGNPENLAISQYYLDTCSRMAPDYLPLDNLRYRVALQLGQPERALEFAARPLLANRLDPHLVSAIGSIARLNGDYAEGEAFFRHALEILPSHYLLKLHLARCLFFSGEHQAGLDIMERCARDTPEGYWARLDLVHYLGVAGRPEEAAQWLEGLADTPVTGLMRFQNDVLRGVPTSWQATEDQRAFAQIDFDMAYWLAECESLAGNLDASLTHLKKAIQNGFTAWDYFDWDPLLAPLRETPGYQALRQEGVIEQRARSDRERVWIEAAAKKLTIDL